MNFQGLLFCERPGEGLSTSRNQSTNRRFCSYVKSSCRAATARKHHRHPAKRANSVRLTRLRAHFKEVAEERRQKAQEAEDKKNSERLKQASYRLNAELTHRAILEGTVNQILAEHSLKRLSSELPFIEYYAPRENNNSVDIEASTVEAMKDPSLPVMSHQVEQTEKGKNFNECRKQKWGKKPAWCLTEAENQLIRETNEKEILKEFDQFDLSAFETDVSLYKPLTDVQTSSQKPLLHNPQTRVGESGDTSSIGKTGFDQRQKIADHFIHKVNHSACEQRCETPPAPQIFSSKAQWVVHRDTGAYALKKRNADKILSQNPSLRRVHSNSSLRRIIDTFVSS